MEINPAYTVDLCPDGTSPSASLSDINVRKTWLENNGSSYDASVFFESTTVGPVSDLKV